jgi:hypothetical protein
MRKNQIKQFFVKNNKTRTLYFNKNKLIESIFDELKINKDIFYLIYAGKVLNIKKTLKYYNIQPNSTIIVYLRAA